MNRKDREIQDIDKILDVIQNASIVNVAFYDKDYPYVIPLNYGYKYEDDNLTLYFHGSARGKKISIMKTIDRVSFCLTSQDNTQGEGNIACNYTTKYRSVCGYGIAKEVHPNEKLQSMDLIMKHYYPEKEFEFNEKMMDKTYFFKIEVVSFSGKANC